MSFPIVYICLTNSVLARVEVCFFFIFCDITRGNLYLYRSWVTKSILLLSECVPSVKVAHIIVMVWRLYLIDIISYILWVSFQILEKGYIIFKYLVMVVLRGPNSQTHNPPKMLAECTHPPPPPPGLHDKARA